MPIRLAFRRFSWLTNTHQAPFHSFAFTPIVALPFPAYVQMARL